MITRVWRGWVPADRAQEYERHCRSEVLPVLRGVAGFERARLLRRMTADDTEVVSLTVLNGLEAVRAVAGPHYETAILADEARDVLGRFDDHALHYETAVET